MIWINRSTFWLSPVQKIYVNLLIGPNVSLARLCPRSAIRPVLWKCLVVFWNSGNVWVIIIRLGEGGSLASITRGRLLYRRAEVTSPFYTLLVTPSSHADCSSPIPHRPVSLTDTGYCKEMFVGIRPGRDPISIEGFSTVTLFFFFFSKAFSENVKWYLPAIE